MAQTTRTRRPAKPRPDALCAEAVDLARDAVIAETGPDQVGEHLGVDVVSDRLMAHRFACLLPGYNGWTWVVTVARAPRAKVVTVCETALLPGTDALVAPEWKPWSERLRPEDIGPDDTLPRVEDDARLDQGYEQTDGRIGDDPNAATDATDADRIAMVDTLGLGRARVVNSYGRTLAAERWQEGEFGPRSAPRRRRREFATCASCGFVTKLAGSLRGAFGVCTNEWSPADGRVVSFAYGCGAHSETTVDRPPIEVPDFVLDELKVETVENVKPIVADEGEDSGDAAAQDEHDSGQDAAAHDEPEA